MLYTDTCPLSFRAHPFNECLSIKHTSSDFAWFFLHDKICKYVNEKQNRRKVNRK